MRMQNAEIYGNAYVGDGVLDVPWADNGIACGGETKS